METSIGIAAGVALAAALPELPYACGLNTVRLFTGDLAAQPLIATDVGGINEIYGPDHRHRLIPANDPATLCEAIRTTLTQAVGARRAQAADLAEHVRRHFSLDTMVDGVLDAYRAALSARASR